MFNLLMLTAYGCFSSLQSIFSQLKLTPSLKKVLFATALGSVALALTAHQLKRRGRKKKQATQGKEGQKTVGIPEALLKSGRPSSLKRGVQEYISGGEKQLCHCSWCINIYWEICRQENDVLCAGPFSGRQMMSPSNRSNDTMSGISSLAPSKHSSSSHSLASVSFTISNQFVHLCVTFPSVHIFQICFLHVCVCVIDEGPKLSKSVG